MIHIHWRRKFDIDFEDMIYSVAICRCGKAWVLSHRTNEYMKIEALSDWEREIVSKAIASGRESNLIGI